MTPFWSFSSSQRRYPCWHWSPISWLAPRRRQGERTTTYESGMEPQGGAWIQFNIRYYMFALVFVVFDVETVFLYPWAVAFHRLGLLAFVEALIFIAILVVALAYAWRKGALEWS